MSIKPGLFAIATAALIGGLCGCGESAGKSGADVSSTNSQTSSPAPATPTSAASGTATSTGPSAAKAAFITMKDFKFTVPTSVATGSKITVKNGDSQNHTVTSSVKGAFDVTANGGGGTGTFAAPTKPGSYPFVCTFHANMKGTLVVK